MILKVNPLLLKRSFRQEPRTQIVEPERYLSKPPREAIEYTMTEVRVSTSYLVGLQGISATPADFGGYPGARSQLGMLRETESGEMVLSDGAVSVLCDRDNVEYIRIIRDQAPVSAIVRMTTEFNDSIFHNADLDGIAYAKDKTSRIVREIEEEMRMLRIIRVRSIAVLPERRVLTVGLSESLQPQTAVALIRILEALGYVAKTGDNEDVTITRKVEIPKDDRKPAIFCRVKNERNPKFEFNNGGLPHLGFMTGINELTVAAAIAAADLQRAHTEFIARTNSS